MGGGGLFDSLSQDKRTDTVVLYPKKPVIQVV